MKLAFLLVLSFFCLHGLAVETNEVDTTGVMLDEISVTGIKQSSLLKDDAESYTVLSRQNVEQLGVVTMRGISDVVPNFYMPDYGSRITSTIYVRGIGARMDQPSVGLNVDNVPFLNKDAYDFDITDIASVEMMRGPQSMLYGRNAMAGVINITTLSPMLFQGWRVFGEFGNGGRINANLGWYHKFNNSIGLSVNGSYSHLDGFFRNEYNGKKLDKENNFSLRAKFQYNPGEQVRIQNVASANILRQGGYPYSYVGTGKIEYNDTCFYRRFTFTDGLIVGYNSDKFNLTSITSVQHIDDNMTLDQDFLPESYFTLTQKKKETSLTEELIIKGDVSTGKYQWLVGAFGFYKHLNMDAPVVFKDVGIRELIESHRNDANPDYPIKWDSRSFPLNSLFTIPTFGFAAYHESTLTAGNWIFRGAVRLDYEKATLNYRSFCDTGYEIYHLVNGVESPYRHEDIKIDDTGKLSQDFLMLLPQVSVLYTLPGALGNVYVKFSEGYKAGGFNTQMFSDVLQQRLMNIMGIGHKYELADIVSYKPEKSWNYEIGSHLSLADHKLNLELTAFYIDCRDQQLTTFPDGTTTGRIMTNAGKTRSFGGELTLNYSPDEKFDFTASYGYTNARFREYFNGIYDFKGKKLPYVPAHTLFLQALYNLTINEEKGLGMIFDINMRGTGPIEWNEENSIRQKFYATLGANVSLLYKNWEFKLWGKNLTDCQYNTFYFKSMGNEFVQRARGIEFGVSARWQF